MFNKKNLFKSNPRDITYINSEVDSLTAGIDRLSFNSKPVNNTKFIASTIVYVDGQEADYSSDEEYTYEEIPYFNFDLQNQQTFPFKPYTTQINDKPTTVGYVNFNDLPLISNNISNHDSTIVKPLLKNLYSSGLERGSQEKIQNTVEISFTLNRLLSLSTRKNDLLTKELNAKSESLITHHKIGVFWKFDWVDSKGHQVSYNTVKTFYQKLKKFDKNKAEEFRAICEKNIVVPYQELRELAKNSPYTQNLVFNARNNNPNIDIYLSIIDGDTKSFNSIYSAYLRIINHYKENYNILPTIISTGYEFTEEQFADYPFVLASNLDRLIRIETAKIMPLGVYYPEPNFCILISPQYNTVPASFIDKSTKPKNLESPALIRNLLKSNLLELYGVENIIAAFANDNPLLTTIPFRARKNKKTKKDINFSKEFISGLGPTEKDFYQFKLMSQSSYDDLVWLDNLYVNRAISVKGNIRTFKGLVLKYLKNQNYTNLVPVELSQIVDIHTLEAIRQAYNSKELAVNQYMRENLRSPDQTELIDYLTRDLRLDLNDFNREFLNIIVTAEILPLIKKGVLSLEDLCLKDFSILKELLYDNEIIALLLEYKNCFTKIYNFYTNFIKLGKDGLEDRDMELLVEALNNNTLMKALTNNIEDFYFLYDRLDNVNIYDLANLYSTNVYENILDKMATQEVVEFLNNENQELEISELASYYRENKELFKALVKSANQDRIFEMGVNEFIEKFEEKQSLRNSEEYDDNYDDGYSDYYNYDITTQVFNEKEEDDCPEGFSIRGSNSDSDSSSEWDTPNDYLYELSGEDDSTYD